MLVEVYYNDGGREVVHVDNEPQTAKEVVKAIKDALADLDNAFSLTASTGLIHIYPSRSIKSVTVSP